MSVSFTPGNHPTSASRTASSSSIPGRINVTTANASERSSSITNTPITSSPLTTNFPRRYPVNRDRNDGDVERQPLIPVQEVNRARTFWPVILGVLVVLGVGLMIGLGGWKLGQGAGEGKWPGGPG